MRVLLESHVVKTLAHDEGHLDSPNLWGCKRSGFEVARAQAVISCSCKEVACETIHPIGGGGGAGAGVTWLSCLDKVRVLAARSGAPTQRCVRIGRSDVCTPLRPTSTVLW